MLVVSPSEVRFGGVTLERVELFAVSRKAVELVVEWGDAGPRPMFADAARIETRIMVVSEVVRTPPREMGVDTPVPGDLGVLSCAVSVGSGVGPWNGGRTPIVVASAMVTKVEYDFENQRGGVARRRIEFLALSSDGVIAEISVGGAA